MVSSVLRPHGPPACNKTSFSKQIPPWQRLQFPCHLLYIPLHTQLIYITTIHSQNLFCRSQDSPIPCAVHRELFASETPAKSSPTPQMPPVGELPPETQLVSHKKKNSDYNSSSTEKACLTKFPIYFRPTR